MIRAALALLLLAACAAPSDPAVGVDVNATPHGVAVTPSVGTTVGGVRVSASPHGGRIGTRIGPVRIGMGF